LEKRRSCGSADQPGSAKTNLIAGYTADLAKLVVKGTEAQAKRHAQLGEAAQTLSTQIQKLCKQRRTFIAMQDEVKSMRATTAPEMLRQVQQDIRAADSMLSSGMIFC